MDWMIAVLLLSLLLQPSSPLVRTLEVSPRVEANHDTFLYLCSLDVNEQNIGVVAYRNYQRHYFFKTCNYLLGINDKNQLKLIFFGYLAFNLVNWKILLGLFNFYTLENLNIETLHLRGFLILLLFSLLFYLFFLGLFIRLLNFVIKIFQNMVTYKDFK